LTSSFKPSLQHYPKNRVGRAGFEPIGFKPQEAKGKIMLNRP
jgi:hypothetical protein